MKTLSLCLAAVLAAVGLSSSCWAGGHGFVMRPGGSGGIRMGHAMPPVAGTWHVRTGQSFITGRPGFAYGHTSTMGRPRQGWGGVSTGYGHTATMYGGRPGFGGQRGVFGHTATLPNGFERYRVGARYGIYNRGRLGYGRYPQVLGGYGYGYGSGYSNGAYGGDYGSGGGTGFVPVPYPAGGYGEAPLASQYSEPSLNQGLAEPPTSVVGVGGPQIIVVNAGGPGCNCRGNRRASPVVYRYGVGTYY